MNGTAAGGAAGGAVAAAAVVNAVKASGAIVRLEPSESRRLLDRLEEPWVVVADAWRGVKYAVAHQGFVFWRKSKSKKPLPLPSRARPSWPRASGCQSDLTGAQQG